MNRLKTNESREMKEAVDLGKRIEISVNGEFQCWDIVRPEESDILENKISIDAPLIKLILGLKTGEEIKGKVGIRDVLVKIRGVKMMNDR